MRIKYPFIIKVVRNQWNKVCKRAQYCAHYTVGSQFAFPYPLPHLALYNISEWEEFILLLDSRLFPILSLPSAFFSHALKFHFNEGVKSVGKQLKALPVYLLDYFKLYALFLPLDFWNKSLTL